MATTGIRTPEQLQQISAQLDAGVQHRAPCANSPATWPRSGRTGPASPRPASSTWTDWQRSGATLHQA